MTEALSREDWERILVALSHLRHNPRFLTTHDKVKSILDAGDR